MTSDHSLLLDHRDHPVLYVDDEPSNLRTFELAFRREFTVFKATTGSEALEILASQPIAVVLSDHRMPGMTGTELLARAREVSPRTVRLLVTAYGDASTLAQAINEGCIYRYVAKPWDPAEMREIVRQAIELHALESDRESRIAELRSVNELSRRMSSQLDADALSDLIVDATVTELGFDAATLFLHREASRALVAHRARSLGEPLGDASRPLAVARAGAADLFRSLEAGRSLLLDLERAPELGPPLRSLLYELAAEQVLVVPLVGRGGLLGALAVDNRRGRPNFSASDRQLLEGVGAQAAIALDNARLMGEVRGDAARASGANGLSAAGALAPSLVRELARPYDELRERPERAADAGWRGEARDTVECFGEILGERDEAQCALGERVRVAMSTLRAWTEGRGVHVELVERDTPPKVVAHPGRLVQLVMHMLESVVTVVTGGGRVEVRILGDARRAAIEVVSRDVDDDVTWDWDGHAVRACEALARDLGGALEMSAGRVQCAWLGPEDEPVAA